MKYSDFLMPKYDLCQVIVSWFQPQPYMNLEQVRITNAMMHDEAMRTREGIEAFSNYVQSLDDSLPENPFPVFHSFENGIYTREIHIEKGYFLIGKLHKHESTVEMLTGKALIADENGTRIVKAPARFVSKPGIKRVGYIIEPIIWIDRHKTNATTVEEAEKELFATSYSELEEQEKMTNNNYVGWSSCQRQ